MRYALQSLGLREKEIDIYLATLELGNDIASSIAQKAKVNRPTTYAVLESLIKKGYVSRQDTKGVIRFSAAHPQILINEAETTHHTLQESLPELLALYNANNNHPKISYYEGEKGIQTLWNLSLQSQEKKIYQIAQVKNMLAMAGEDFLKQYVYQRAQKGIQNFCIDEYEGQKDLNTDYPTGTNKALLRQVRIAPPHFTAFGITIIFDNKVIFASSQKESFGFLIESREYHTMMMSFFNTLWEISTP